MPRSWPEGGFADPDPWKRGRADRETSEIDCDRIGGNLQANDIGLSAFDGDIVDKFIGARLADCLTLLYLEPDLLLLVRLLVRRRLARGLSRSGRALLEKALLVFSCCAP